MGRTRSTDYRQFRRERLTVRALLCAWLLFFLTLLVGVVFLAAAGLVPLWMVIATPLPIVGAATLMVQYRFLPAFARLRDQQFQALRTLQRDEIERIRRNRRQLRIAARILTLLWAVSIPIQGKLMFACGSELWAGLLLLQLFAVFICFLLAWEKTVVGAIILVPFLLLFFVGMALGRLLAALILLPFRICNWRKRGYR